MNKIELKKYLNINIVLLLIIIASILFGDFAGWFHGNYYLKIYQEGYIYMGSGILTTLVLTILVVISGNSIKFLLEVKKNEGKDKKLLIKNINKVLKNTKYLVWIVLIAAIIFVLKAEWDDTEERWLDIWFFIPFIFWITVILINKRILKDN